MVLTGVLQRFAEQGPVVLMARLVLERTFTPAKLDELFGRVARRQYHRELFFSAVFELMSLVAFKAFPTVHAAYQKRRGQIGVSVTSLYNKLSTMEPEVSRAVVRETAAELGREIVDLKGARRPWLPGYQVKVLDGNCIEATEHRLAVLRKTPAGPLPGKSLVVYDPALEMAIDVFPCEDGHAQERALLQQVAATVEAGDVWIMDRNFCVRDFLQAIVQRDAHFICRYHLGLLLSSVEPERRVGATETGMVYESWVEISADDKGKRRYRLIRIDLKRPTRDGETKLYILTDLSKTAANAKLIALMYRRRWTIETMFQELEGHLNSEVNSLGYPKAALFAFCTALVGYNAFAVTKAALRRAHGEDVVETLSGYYIALEFSGCHIGMAIATSPEEWSQFRAVAHREFLALLIRIARGADLLCYRKHVRGPKKPRPKRTEYLNTPHVSTARLLRDQHGRS
jgi:hypothetical protein